MPYQREFDRRIRVGLVGAGSHAYRNILPALNHLPVELKAICDLELQRAEVTATQYGIPAYREMEALIAGQELDAVLLCVSADAHPPLAVKAFGAGLHVWMEKPPARFETGVLEMLEAQGDRICMVGFKKVFMPAAIKLRELLGEQHRGQFHSLLAVYPLSVPRAEAVAEGDAEGGMWLADGCHPLALMRSIGGPVKSVRTLRASAAGGACILEFHNGALGNLHLADGAPWSQPFERYVVYGDEFSITIENSSRVVYQRGIPFDYTTTASFAPSGTEHGALVWEAQASLNTIENKSAFIQGIYGELREFCNAVLNDQPPQAATLDEALAVTRLVNRAMESNGQAIEIEEVAT